MDNVNELITLVRQLQTTVDTLSTAVAELDTKVQKINHLQKLLDVEIQSLTIGDLLQYSNDGKWHNIQPSALFVSTTQTGGVTKLSELSDVIISNPPYNQALTYNSLDGKWHNNTIETGGGSTGDLSEYLTKAEAALTYFPLSGGDINGNVKIIGNLLVTGGITAYNE